MSFHKKNGCFVDQDGVKSWYRDGKLHREDGPAVEYADGTKEWYLGGQRFTKQYFTSIEMIERMQAWELFEPKELVEIRRLTDNRAKPRKKLCFEAKQQKQQK